MNKMILIGFAGKDGKTSATQTGRTMTRLSIANFQALQRRRW